MIVLYSTGCPKCRVLEAKLTKTGQTYTIINDVDKMTELGISEVPVLEVNGKLMNFGEAVKWANAEAVELDCPTCKL